MGIRSLALIFKLLCLFISASINATTFIPLPIQDQVDASDSAVMATNTGKAYKKLPSGDVVTEYSFKLDLASGLPKHKVTSPNSFKVLVPGGLWQGRYYQVHGAASFVPGEQSLLFLKQTPHGWVVNNLSMGKFEILDDAQGRWFRNTIFPTHPKLGLISLEKMNEHLAYKFETPLVEINNDKYVYDTKVDTNKDNVSVLKSRAPASIQETEADLTSNSSYGLFWMMIMLGMLGFLYRIRAKKSE